MTDASEIFFQSGRGGIVQPGDIRGDAGIKITPI
jgi:hypothetical protein